MAGKRLNKTQVIAELSTMTEIDKKHVATLLDALSDLTIAQLKSEAREFVLPGLVKMKAADKPATEAREGINPHTREKMIIPAKPASITVRASALKALKDAIN